MKRITTLLTLLLMACITFAADNSFSMEVNDFALTDNVNAADQLYNDMVSYGNEELNADATANGSQAFSITNSMPADDAFKADNFMARQEQKYGYYCPAREMELSSIPLIAFGLIAKGNKKDFRAARNNFIPAYENRLDDWLQHVPLMAVFGMKLGGYESRSEWMRFLVSGVSSYAFMGLFTNSIKYSAKEMRPDGSTANSFPSGHTATAFVAATIMHKEYGLTRSPWWSVLAYGCATTTGIMRTLNNRHWISDILVGAGIGIISTDLGYMMGDLIYKKKQIRRQPLEGRGDLLKNPSFFKVSLGMQFSTDLKMPTYTEFTTLAHLWSKPEAATLEDDYYAVLRNGNPFRIPDTFNNNEDGRTFSNYSNSIAGNGDGSQIYKDPKIKVGTGTTIGAEAAYFFNKYIGAGAMARITTAPVYADGLSCYDMKNQLYVNSNSVSDVWSIVDINAGLYFSLPLSSRHNIGCKAYYGRKFYSSIDLIAAYDMNFKNTQTEEVGNLTMYGDNLYFENTDTDAFGCGIQYTYSMGNGMAVSAFCDYDFARPEFDVAYIPYNTDARKMMLTRSQFKYRQSINTFTAGASLVVTF